MDLQSVSSMDDAQIRKCFSLLVAVYSQRVQRAVDDGESAPEPLETDMVTATDVVITCQRMLRSFEIAPFELEALGY